MGKILHILRGNLGGVGGQTLTDTHENVRLLKLGPTHRERSIAPFSPLDDNRNKYRRHHQSQTHPKQSDNPFPCCFLLPQSLQSCVTFRLKLLVLLHGQHPVAHPLRFSFHVCRVKTMEQCRTVGLVFLFINLPQQRHDGSTFHIIEIGLHHLQ